MKAITATMILIFLSGCASHSIEKGTYVSRLSMSDFGRVAIEENPEYHYCFGKTKKEASQEMQIIWQDKIYEQKRYWPDVIDQESGGTLAIGVGEEVDRQYTQDNAKNFSLDNLSYPEKSQCEKLYARNEGWFVAGIK